MTFKTQKQIWEHLIANEGKPCLKHKRESGLYGLLDGEVYDFSSSKLMPITLCCIEDWQPYTEPEPCWLDHEAKKRKLINEGGSAFWYRIGAEELAHEAIRRIEAASEKFKRQGIDVEPISINIIKELIGEKE